MRSGNNAFRLKMMTIGEIKRIYQDKEETPCPLTEKLVKAGYQQVGGGYIDRAKRNGIRVNYEENSPSQYWHLMTYCDSRNRIIESADLSKGSRPIYDRIKWNHEIQKLCFEKIIHKT